MTAHKNKGRFQLQLRCFNKIRKTTGVHRLIAKSFIPNPNNKPEVNHINGNPSDNRIENLEWCTRKENSNHAWKNGLMENVRKSFVVNNLGVKNHNSKLTKKIVLEIRKKYIPWKYSTVRLAKEYNLSRSNVHSIVKNKTWNFL
jgi:hypothetical protein